MTRVHRTLHAPYTPRQLFDLVADVRAYPDFVRWIRSLRVLHESATDGVWNGRAEARVGFRGFSERFTTDIAARAEEGVIDVRLVNGPLRMLTNRWTFRDEPQGAKIEFEVSFEFRNPLLQALAAANLDLAVSRLVQSFLDEARRRYGAPPITSASGTSFPAS